MFTSLHTRLIGLIAVVCLATISNFAAPPAVHAASFVPAQFIAKLYTEAFGRIPDHPGWQLYTNKFATEGCSSQKLQEVGIDIYTSAEFNSLGYDNASKLLALYRGALSREPDQYGFNIFYNRLQTGTAWNTIVSDVFVSTEFNSLVQSMCSGSGAYRWRNSPIISLPTSQTGNFAGGTASQLQSIINTVHANGGGTVYLEQKAVVILDQSIEVKPGVTLTTVGNLTPTKYAAMGRLVRGSTLRGQATGLPSSIVYVRPGATLTGVWIEGQRANIGPRNNEVSLFADGSVNITTNRFSDASGGTSILTWGNAEGNPCTSGTQIRDNLITSYASHNDESISTDGITNACEKADIIGNQIVDVTDVAVVLLRSDKVGQQPVVRQQSSVQWNKVLNASNWSYSAFVVDTLRKGIEWPSDYTGTSDFSGAVVSNNTVWTGPRGLIDIVLSVGSRPWWGNSTVKGTGPTFTYNGTGSQSVNTNIAIAVSGMHNVNVQGNNITIASFQQYGSCPKLSIAAAASAGYASGVIQQTYTDTDVSACILHNRPNTPW